MDLFDYAAYPRRPGYKEPSTSRDAAKAIAGASERLRDRVFAAIAAAGPDGLTADQAASALACTPFAVRPRVTELCRMGLVEPTGARRANDSGMSAKVWRARA